jgi:IMP dehydrogenase
MNLQNTYSFDDIGLIPRELSTIKSRDDVDTSIDFLGWKLSLPILASPMESAVGLEMAQELSKLGGLACLPRTKDKQADQVLFARVGHGHIPSFDSKENLYWSPVMKTVCIDVANGFNKYLGERIKEIKKMNSDIKIITGNVGSLEGYIYLDSLGVDAVRIGIGSGSICSSGIVTPIGIGSFTLIREIAEYKEQYGAKALIIADGGIKGSREIVLALAAGADITMAGKIFASAKESPGPVVKFGGNLLKPYAGQASKTIKRSDKYIEGEDTLISYKGRIEQIWNKLGDGVRSSLSYMNIQNIEKLKYLPDECFCLLSQGARTERQITA